MLQGKKMKKRPVKGIACVQGIEDSIQKPTEWKVKETISSEKSWIYFSSHQVPIPIKTKCLTGCLSQG